MAAQDPKEYQLSIARFIGVNQALEENDISFEYAVTAKNAITETGVLRPVKGCSAMYTAPAGCSIESAVIYYHDNNDGSTTQYILAGVRRTGGVFDLLAWDPNAWSWSSIKGDEELHSANFESVTYLAGSTSMCILANGADDLYKWAGSGTIEKLYYRDEETHAPRAAALALHYERIWATGVNSNPESLFYSDDMNPEGWTSGTDAAGEIQLLTYTGDRFVAVKNIMDDVVAFKERSIHRIVGTYPGEYQAVQVYTGEGTIAPKSICTGNGAAFFLSADGIYTYSGMTADRLQPKALYNFYGKIWNAQSACGIVHKNKLYMAVPTERSWGDSNDTVIVYDLDTGAFQLLELPIELGVCNWLDGGDALWFAAGSGIYAIDNSEDYAGQAIDMEWITPMSDLGMRNTDKRISTVYITGRGGDLEVVAKADHRRKSKVIVLPDGMAVKRLRFSVHGRRIGLELRNVQGSMPEVSGITVVYEQNED